MRIVGGTFRGRRLAAVRGRDVRPTSDRVREAVFNILGDVSGMAVLDLFAGTGAMGLEALSRGASHATFVEIDRQAYDVVHRNIEATVSTEGASTTDLVKGDAVRVVQTLAMAGERYDLVIFDPPYERTQEMLTQSESTLPGALSAEATIVLELSTRHADLVDAAAAGWGGTVRTSRKYGDTTVAIIDVVAANGEVDAPFAQADHELDDAVEGE